MNNEEKKEYLLQYKKSKKRIKNLREQLFSLMEVGKSAKIQRLSDMPKGSSRQKDLSDLMVRIEKLRIKIDDEITKSIKTRIEIEEHILRMKDDDEATVLRMRYIEMLKWEEIERRMRYSRSHVIRIHGYALKNFKNETQ